MAEAFQYLELWTGLQAAGGTRLGFIGVATQIRRRRSVTGDNAKTFVMPRGHRLAASIEKGRVIREVLSVDGATWREWVIDTYARSSGASTGFPVSCVSPMALLVNYPVETTDADGYVYQDTAAVQLTPANIITNWIRSRTPSWIVNNTITPTGLTEVAFSDDSALSGMRRLEEAVPGYETDLVPLGTTQYGLNFAVIGGSAPTLYLRTAKNIRSLSERVQPGQVNRVGQIRGKEGDDGPSGIAWAYWEVEATSGAGPYRVKLKAIHGGPGPIQFDDQLNHANLPGGANSLYLERRDGTTVQITDSFASTQEVEVGNLTATSVGDWVRVVASSTGKHLTHLDAPSEIATYGVQGGRYESAWDDTLCVLKNALQANWATPSGPPDGWTGLGSRTTTTNEWVTSGQALLVNQSVSDGAQIAAPPARTWRIRARKTFWSATALIRLRAAIGAGDVTFRVKANGTVVGTGLVYLSPVNAYRQLKISGLDLSAFVGSDVTLVAEIVKSGGTGTVNMIVDHICLGPSLNPRAPTVGSNAARTWQGINDFLDTHRSKQVAWEFEAVDLERLGVPAQTAVELGQQVVAVDDDLGTVQARLLEIEDNPQDPRETRYTVGTLPARLSRKQSAPAELVIPFLEPIEVKVAERDTRITPLFLKATQTAASTSTVTISLEAKDPHGAALTVTYAAFGATYSSGSGTGPYVFNRPANGSGPGRVVFTLSSPGRESVTDAIDVPEVSAADTLLVRVERQAVTLTTITYRVRVKAQGTSAVNLYRTLAGVTLSPNVTDPVSLLVTNDWATTGTQDYTVVRPLPADGPGTITWHAEFGSLVPTYETQTIPVRGIMPTYGVSQSAEGDTSTTVTVTIQSDPESRVTGVEFATQEGRGALSSFVLDSSAPFTQVVNTAEGLPSKVFFRIKGTLMDGTSGTLVEDFVTVNPSAKPGAPEIIPEIDASGNVIVRLVGDSLAQSWRVASAKGTNPAVPSDATVDAASPQGTGRHHTTGTLQTIAVGEKVAIKVRAYSGASGSGQGSEYVAVVFNPRAVKTTRTIVIDASEFAPATSGTTWQGRSFGVIQPNSAGSAQVFTASLDDVPAGATLTNATLRYLRKSGGADTVAFYIKKGRDPVLDSSPTLLVNQPSLGVTDLGGGQYGDTSSTLSEVIDAAYKYWAQVEMTDASIDSLTPAVSFLKLTFETTDFGQ